MIWESIFILCQSVAAASKAREEHCTQEEVLNRDQRVICGPLRSGAVCYEVDGATPSEEPPMEQQFTSRRKASVLTTASTRRRLKINHE